MADENDTDEKVRVIARNTVDDLRARYWAAKQANPAPSFDDLFDLRCAFEDAAVGYAALEGRLLRDDLLTRPEDVRAFAELRGDMAQAAQVREVVGVAVKFISRMAAVA